MPGTRPGKGQLEANSRRQLPNKRLFEFPRTALRFRGNDGFEREAARFLGFSHTSRPRTTNAIPPIRCVHALARRRGPRSHASVSAALDARLRGHDEEWRGIKRKKLVARRSVLGRINSLVFEIVSLIDRFISLFGPVGNFHSAVSEYQRLAGI